MLEHGYGNTCDYVSTCACPILVVSYIYAYVCTGQLGDRASVQKATGFEHFEHASNEVVFQI